MIPTNAGIIYMSFGKTSLGAATKSLESIRKLGIDLPVISVGTQPIPGTTFMEWKGERPFGKGPLENCGFRAGMVKPFLYQYSPFKYNLYLDADIEAMSDFSQGFNLLRYHDICIADSRRTNLREFYTYEKTEKEWEIGHKEKRYTIKVFGDYKYHPINSGVIFFKNNGRSKLFFKEWYKEWLRFPGWDEQMAFLRAERNCSTTDINHLPIQWNTQRMMNGIIFYHHWGTARDIAESKEQKP
jgi:hypothetical protein